MFGIEQPRLEGAPEILIGQNPRAVDLVLERGLLERLGLRVVVKHLQQVVGAEILGR